MRQAPILRTRRIAVHAILGAQTLIVPLVAPWGTVVVIELALWTVNAASVPLKRTAVAPVKLLPVSVTAVPVGPLVGEKELIVGGCGPPEPLVAAW